MDTIFTVKNEDLERLNPEETVNFLRELLWAEATALGINKHLINVPSAITDADGGIDAEVKDAIVNGGQGIIKQGLTRYQIKTGNYSLGNDANVKGILFKVGLNELKPRVKSCLDSNGTLVIVLFGWDKPEQEDEHYLSKFKKKLISINNVYQTANIEIWPQNKLLGFLQPFPSLALRLNKRGELIFQSHNSWSLNAEMSHPFIAGAEQKKRSHNIAEILRNNESTIEATHIRIYGDPGIGKTRLVLEATRESDLEPLVIYCQSAGQFKNSDLMNEIMREDNSFKTIFVVDECNKYESADIWDKLKYRGSRIKLIPFYARFFKPLIFTSFFT